jgi:hypothetical protein
VRNSGKFQTAGWVAASQVQKNRIFSRPMPKVPISTRMQPAISTCTARRGPSLRSSQGAISPPITPKIDSEMP